MVLERTYGHNQPPELREISRSFLEVDVMDIHISEDNHVNEVVKCIPTIYMMWMSLERELSNQEKLDLYRTHSMTHDAVFIRNEEIEKCMANDGGFVRYHLIGKESVVCAFVESIHRTLNGQLLSGK
jgi:hypothetical protein